MGLDHWLNRKINLRTQYSHINTKVNKIETTAYDAKIFLPTENVDSICYEIICWRKANAIHRWFVENIQDGKDDCEYYSVSIDELKSFLKTLKRVEEIKLEIIKEHGSIKKDISLRHKDELSRILPPQEGFFFGNAEYGEWYFEDVSSTIVELEKEFKFIDENNKLEIEYEYSSSW